MDEDLTLDTLIAKIKDKDDKVRAAAWQAAGKVGAQALKPLAAVAAAADGAEGKGQYSKLSEEIDRLREEAKKDDEKKKLLAEKLQERERVLESPRAANRAMWQIVRYTGRPGAEDERKATVSALVEVFTDGQLPVQLHRDVIWMLSEVVTNDEYDPAQAAEQFKNPDFRDDLRMALQRIPGDNAIAALKAALEIVPDDFKPAIACSLRARGVDVPDVPCVKLKPTKQTSVKPVGR